jgi:hypothetical protein
MTSQDTPGVHDFDFLIGDWDVRHRKLKHRLADSDEWLDFAGVTAMRRLGHGVGNLDENWLEDPAGGYGALTVRYLDRTGLWSIYWIDSRHPQMDPAMRGRFEQGIGTFHAEDVFEGKPIRVRFVWTPLTATSARWEQAFSPDGGATWEVNWIMDFSRQAG